MATRHAAALGTAAAGVAGLALLTTAWVPAVALVPLLGLAVVALAEVLLPLPHQADRSVEPGDRLLLGQAATIRVAAAGPTANLVVEEEGNDALRVRPGGHTLWRPAPPARQQKGRRVSETTMQVDTARRGRSALGAIRLSRVGAAGVWRRRTHLPQHTAVTVLPATARQHRVRVRARASGHQGVPASHRRGAGDEFHALREYAPGDPLGDMNWKATARMGRPVVNQHLPQEPPRVLLYVDTRAFAADQDAASGRDAFERNLELASVLADALLGERAQVGLVLLSYWSRFLVPAAGAAQGRRIRDMVLECRPGDDAPLVHLVEGGAPHLPARADALLVTANAYDETLQAAVQALRRRHGRVLVAAAAFSEPEGPSRDDGARRAAGRLLNAELAHALQRLRVHRSALWHPGDPIHVTLAGLGLAGRGR